MITGQQRRTRPARRRPQGPAPAAHPLAGAGHPHLAPPGWSIGRRISELVRREPFTTAEATAVSLAVLSALGALHRAGRSHGAVGADTVGVGLDGWIRLSADRAVRGTGAAGDVAATGRLLCLMLGIEAEPRPGRTPDAERATPALVAVARRLASGGSGWSAEAAWTAVHDGAGLCGTEPQLVKALAELGARAAGRTEIERAVTRVVLGPPLASEGAAAPTRRRLEAPMLPRPPRLRHGVLPALSEAATQPRRLRPGTRLWTGLLLALVLCGAVAGGIAGVLASRPAAARAAEPHSQAARPKAAAKPAAADQMAATPTAAVGTFFQLVQQQKLDQAALLWKPRMSSAVDLGSRFGGLRSVSLQRNDLLAEDGRLGIATVAVDWTEVDADGSTHEYAGDIYLSTGPQLWRWDSWSVQEVTPPPAAAPGGGGGGGEGDGG